MWNLKDINLHKLNLFGIIEIDGQYSAHIFMAKTTKFILQLCFSGHSKNRFWTFTSNCYGHYPQ